MARFAPPVTGSRPSSRSTALSRRQSGSLGVLRDCAAVLVVGLFLLPILWWALTSIKPDSAIFDPDGPVLFDFAPTLEHYRAVFGSGSILATDNRQAFIDTILVASASTALAVVTGLFAAYGLSRFPSRGARAVLWMAIFFRILPPIVLVVPSVFLLNAVGLFNSRLGLILLHATMHAPIAVLLLKSFVDDVPREVDEAARLDGANGWQVIARIIVPQIRGGIAATAILCFLFSFTEFLVSLFVTVSFRTIPVKLAVLANGDWGAPAALGTAALAPAFLVILLVQRHLVRGLTLGIQR